MICQGGKPFNIGAGDAALPTRNRIARRKRRRSEFFLALSAAGTKFGKHLSKPFRPKTPDIRFFAFFPSKQLFNGNAERNGQIVQLRYIRLRQSPLPLGNSLRMDV